MLISADWVLPVAAPPIPEGAVLVSGDRVVSVGSLAELKRDHPTEHHEHFACCTLAPGLVNAHTHLTLSALAGVVPPLPFAQWLPRLVKALKPWEIADHEASGVVGAEECLSCGVTVVGDIAYGAAEVARASAAGLGGVYYWELLGIHAEEIDALLSELRYPQRPDFYSDRVVCGLSPHSPYTSGPDLLRAVHERAESLRVPSAIHLAESEAELQLLRDGTGPLAPTAARTAFGFTPRGRRPAEYLAELGVLAGSTLVHLCHISGPELELLGGQARGAVTCPRSNRYLDNPPPEVRALLEAGLPVGVGTDSSASNEDLDLMSEVRAVHSAEPSLTPSQLLRLATQGGADAIGVGDRYGRLAPGVFADIGVFRIEHSGEPETDFVEQAGRECVHAVMSAGVWRVRDGALLERDAQAAARAAQARDRSIEALSRD